MTPGKYISETDRKEGKVYSAHPQWAYTGKYQDK